MVDLTLSWDLFIVVFFAIVMSYSFIIGQHQSMKIIIATYIAIIATLGIGNVLARFIGDSQAVFTSFGLPFDITLVSLAKIFLFAICILIFVIRSGIELSVDKDAGMVFRVIYTGLFGFSTAGLMVSTVLTYVSGGNILDTSILTNSTIISMAQGSTLMQLMILNQDIWFTLPAFLIIVTGLMHND
jgi:hypothetical protein